MAANGSRPARPARAKSGAQATPIDDATGCQAHPCQQAAPAAWIPRQVREPSPQPCRKWFLSNYLGNIVRPNRPLPLPTRARKKPTLANGQRHNSAAASRGLYRMPRIVVFAWAVCYSNLFGSRTLWRPRRAASSFLLRAHLSETVRPTVITQTGVVIWRCICSNWFDASLRTQ